jgi:hypothetical protein
MPQGAVDAVSSTFDFIRNHADLIVPVAILAAWLALQLWILPRFGVST